MAVKTLFVDPSRCIGCRSCEAACRECDSHKGESMVYHRLHRSREDRGDVAHPLHALRGPAGPLRAGLPGQAILVTPDGVVQLAEESRCIGCRNCVYACPFGVPKFDGPRRVTCGSATSATTGPAMSSPGAPRLPHAGDLLRHL